MSTAPPKNKEATAEAIFSLFTLGCSGCSGIIERKLKKLDGVRDVAVNYVADIVRIDYDPRKLTTEDIRGFLKKLGYDTTETH